MGKPSQNRVSPKALLHSKWTKKKVNNKEKHFSVVSVTIEEDQTVSECLIQAVINQAEYSIDWRELKNPDIWCMGWK